MQCLRWAHSHGMGFGLGQFATPTTSEPSLTPEHSIGRTGVAMLPFNKAEIQSCHNSVSRTLLTAAVRFEVLSFSCPYIIESSRRLDGRVLPLLLVVNLLLLVVVYHDIIDEN